MPFTPTPAIHPHLNTRQKTRRIDLNTCAIENGNSGKNGEHAGMKMQPRPTSGQSFMPFTSESNGLVASFLKWILKHKNEKTCALFVPIHSPLARSFLPEKLCATGVYLGGGTPTLLKHVHIRGPRSYEWLQRLPWCSRCDATFGTFSEANTVIWRIWKLRSSSTKWICTRAEWHPLRCLEVLSIFETAPLHDHHQQFRSRRANPNERVNDVTSPAGRNLQLVECACVVHWVCWCTE